jgi:hypothetical protein
VTVPGQCQSRRRTGRIQSAAAIPVEWAGKLAERPSTPFSTPYGVRRHHSAAPLPNAHAQELPDAPDRC